jgi:hypothetical protein
MVPPEPGSKSNLASSKTEETSFLGWGCHDGVRLSLRTIRTSAHEDPPRAVSAVQQEV